MKREEVRILFQTHLVDGIDLRLKPAERIEMLPKGKTTLFLVNQKRTLVHVVFADYPEANFREPLPAYLKDHTTDQLQVSLMMRYWRFL